MKCNMKNLFKSFVVLLAVMAAVPSFAQKAPRSDNTAWRKKISPEKSTSPRGFM
jgi:predicted small lipoprotein YifL